MSHTCTKLRQLNIFTPYFLGDIKRWLVQTRHNWVYKLKCDNTKCKKKMKGISKFSFFMVIKIRLHLSIYIKNFEWACFTIFFNTNFKRLLLIITVQIFLMALTKNRREKIMLANVFVYSLNRKIIPKSR